ncbi:uncharacterized protein LOC123564120 [Mercenaria mercenaria]|uniref:uncharacterized protein LOC123564120 n=1 Tax=Mercenaria mercenaria TaxID=6596 RepID=UPI00234E771F|nr:uncharacterized protein LOC123564120 [Mercenaria mercenaria]
MPGTARRGRRSATAKKASTENVPSDSEPADTEESVLTDTTDTAAAADSEKTKETENEEGSEPQGDEEKRDNGAPANEDKGEEGITVDLEIKDEIAVHEDKAKETVEVMIEGVAEKEETETAGQEEVTDVTVSEVDTKMNTEDEKKLTSDKDTSELATTKKESNDTNVEKEVLVTDNVAAAKTDIEEKTPLDTDKVTAAEESMEEETKINTEDTTASSAETDQAKETADTPPDPVTPTKDQSVADTKPSPTPSSSPEVTKTNTPDQEQVFNRPFPASIAKLRNLTVNIGPIRQMDLKSDKLHEILKLSDNFEIKFELKDKESGGKVVQEKCGFVRLPLGITTPTFLIRVAYRLGNLHIDGRDMSVKFPEAFNNAVEECKQYIDENRKLKADMFEKRKRQIAVKNVPPNVTEDTIRSLFPEAQKITLSMEDLPDGGKKVGSVLLDFDTEEACIQCLDTNKDVFIEDCQLKIFRLYSEKKYRSPRSQNFFGRQQSSRGRGLGRGRGMAQRGSFQAAKIRNRALGFGGATRGRGGIVKRGNQGRNTTGTVQSSPQASAKSPGAMGPPKASPKGLIVPGRSQRNRSIQWPKPVHSKFVIFIIFNLYIVSTSYCYNVPIQTLLDVLPLRLYAGSYQSPASHEGQFKDFTPKRENNRGRQRSRAGRGRGKQGYEQRREERNPSFRGEQSRQSPYRTDRSPSNRSTSSYRSEQRYSSPSTSRADDPMAMMEYLKTTIARMEEKMTGRDSGDRGYNARHEEQSRSSHYSPRGRGSPSRGRGRGRGDQSRKRPAETREYGQEAKRQFMGELQEPQVQDQGRRDTRADYYGSQQNTSTVERRDSVGRMVAEGLSSYRHDRDSGNHGGSYGGSYGSSQGGSYGSSQGGSYGSSHGGNQSGNYGNRSGSYGDSGDRNRRDNYSGRSESYSTGYSGGGGQFSSRGGGGRGQSRGRGYNKGNRQGQLW